jgi:hypothetical protein
MGPDGDRSTNFAIDEGATGGAVNTAGCSEGVADGDPARALGTGTNSTPREATGGCNASKSGICGKT